MSISRLKISRRSEPEVRDTLNEFHVLTYAEDGFSPLDIHARRLGVDRERAREFASAVNERSEVGSLYPLAPISAVPRDLLRGTPDIAALAASVADFLRANRELIKARRVAIDFRTPSVPSFSVQAISSALDADDGSVLEEVLILEM